ncbi:sodium- and chloride-dependent GABA transporter 2-like [Tribolium madens]|uniref:sodium- and chloride-dependent GABA transporter 2-like n=1 Tax=Tribolium madens TaxID=41895 RepID=UPI001CF73FE8|nr:sodium- and chloride-dependent GABA transporter 2-like [Tribolium madens]XP_044262975.1 sodium- and chloride-dependent GABA transporter 2-like [Tribolium madens]XP_044262986.1 sodium- and chloride-dependent GABA transporter 2-like [Tribolium madens]XP_044262995.1 sodium- and chloride-dependent GABA transporter 2-like [Tribolium madens]XP_044263004.1 sodium- and chloride-dependent GABA transporter 2-like [Tribolium madens]XP_044263013.1 sodium- and chloride-dependent GABA transporter 2-like 
MSNEWGSEIEAMPSEKELFMKIKMLENNMQERKLVTYKQAQDNDRDRGGWGNKLDFLFSCISLSVGLGNVWRFPYLCYKNGGGAFIVTYTIAMIVCGIPMFFQEVAIGQYLGSGGMTFVGQLCPILKGVGYAAMTIVFLLDVYYCIIISWTIFYLMSMFSYLPVLPWSGCDNWWNTAECFSSVNNSTSNLNFNSSKFSTSVEEYFERRVLGISSGIEDIGGIQWGLFVCLALGWIIVYVIIRKGLHQSGKIIWFTALFPYVVLLILLGRAVTLKGASDGLFYFIMPRWEKLLTPGPWMDGATQIFFAYSIGCGALPALGSYNKFHHNCYKDSLITCVINTLTSLLAGVVTFSILGYIAAEQNVDVGHVVKTGPGLVFLTYPEVVLKIPGAPFWAATFFIMLVILGIDSEFCLVEAFITGIVDNWSEQLRPHRSRLTVIVSLLMFLLGIPMVTNGGMYIFQLMDYYSASGISLLWVCFFQSLGISWIFGVDKINDCIKQMVGVEPNKYWTICWKYCGPLIMIVIFTGHCIEYTNVTYDTYKYPKWAEYIGFGLSLSSMVWIPLYAIYYIVSGPGTIFENLKAGVQPMIKQRKIAVCDKRTGLPITESNIGLISPSQSII